MLLKQKRAAMQEAYGGRILFTPSMPSSDRGDRGADANRPSAGATSANGLSAQPAQTASAPPASIAADGPPAANEAAAAHLDGAHDVSTNGVHSPDDGAAGSAAAPAVSEPARDPPPGQQPPPGTAAEPQSGGNKPPGLQSPARDSGQQQEEQQGSKQQQRSALFDGHDLSPGTQMLHVGDEVEFTLVADHNGADPRATRV